MRLEEKSACCLALKGQYSSGEGTTYDVCSKCKKQFIPAFICRPCGIQWGNGKPKGLSARIVKEGTCGWCGRKGAVVPPIFYNIKP